MLDFQGAGVDGGDVSDYRRHFAFAGELDINPQAGAPLPGAGDGITQVVYVNRSGKTCLIADDNDDGVLDGTDFAVEFKGRTIYTVDDFDNDFVIAGTNGDDVIVGTEGGDRIFAAGGDDLVHRARRRRRGPRRRGDDFLDGGPAASTTCSARTATTR